MTYESQNLPFLTDVPAMPDNMELMEWLLTVKELIEEMLGRRGNQPLTPQFQMGKYMGDGLKVPRLIPTLFRPKYVKVFADPSDPTIEYSYEKMDDNEQDINWEGYSFRHRDSANYHDFVAGTGIYSVTDEGFTVYAGTSGGNHPNLVSTYYNWIAFG